MSTYAALYDRTKIWREIGGLEIMLLKRAQRIQAENFGLKDPKGNTMLTVTSPVSGFARASQFELISTTPPPPPPPPPNPEPTPEPKPISAFRHLHDYELAAKKIRRDDGSLYTVPRNSLAGTPEVFQLLNVSIPLSKQWQFFLRAINPAMSPQHVAALLGHKKAFCNHQGFGDPTDPRANYILGEYLDKPSPKFDATYMCGGGLISGAVEQNKIRLVTMDGNFEPLLKFGKTYPSKIQDVRLEDYLYNPKDNPDMFIVAVNVTSKGTPFPFTNGGFYDWTPDRKPYSFLPLVSRGPVLYPLDRLQPVSQWTTPYA